MEHSNLVPLVILKKQRLPIIQIARLIINFYKNLEAIDINFSRINIIADKASLYQNINVNHENATQDLAGEILNQNINDIRKFNNVIKPDIGFSMDNMVSIGLETKIIEDTLITLSYSFSNKLPRIASIVVNKKCFDSFEKAKIFLEIVEKSFSIEYSVIKVSDRDINKISRRYKAPLGWITYFSNDYEISVPNDLEGIQYEHTENGKYLILTKENPTDSAVLDTNKEKLITLMEEIKERVPNYGK